MKLVLNIYSRERDENGNRIISKTYKANDYELLYGVVEDVLNLFDPKNYLILSKVQETKLTIY